MNKKKTDQELLVEWGTLAQDRRELLRQLEDLNKKLSFVSKASADVTAELITRGYVVGTRS